MTGDHTATGGCLCGAVRYEVHGPLRDVVLCHCSECRRWTGHVLAATAARSSDLIVVRADGLRWFDSPASDRGLRLTASRKSASAPRASVFARA